jgi:hypothetical protein
MTRAAADGQRAVRSPWNGRVGGEQSCPVRRSCCAVQRAPRASSASCAPAVDVRAPASTRRVGVPAVASSKPSQHRARSARVESCALPARRQSRDRVPAAVEHDSVSRSGESIDFRGIERGGRGRRHAAAELDRRAVGHSERLRLLRLALEASGSPRGVRSSASRDAISGCHASLSALDVSDHSPGVNESARRRFGPVGSKTRGGRRLGARR